MKRRFALLALSLSLCIAVSCPARGNLADDIDAVLQDPLLSRANLGVDIVRLGRSAADATNVYQMNSTLALIPASNLKVITTSAALDRLGAGFKFRTLLLLHDGNLILIGDGDPTLGDAELLKKVGWSVDTVFKTWAAGLLQRHIAAQDLLVDDSVFDEQFLHDSWPADQVDKRYVAEIAGLNLNANCIDVYVQPHGIGQLVGFRTDPATRYVSIRNNCIGGDDNAIWLGRQPGTVNDLVLRGKARTANDVPVSVTVHDPPMYAGTVLAETLRAGGVALSGAVRRDRAERAAYVHAAAAGDGSWTVLAMHETPLASVIDRANKDSMNLYAECLCKRLGFAVSGAGTWASGTSAVGDFLQSLKIPSSQYTLDDGCGLSKHNAISAQLMVRVLAHDFFSRDAEMWMQSLAVAGEDGTLADRFRGTDLRGRVIAKTGFVNGVSCLSGYLRAKDDAWYCFSIMFNGIPEGTNSGAKTLQERIVRALDLHSVPQPQAGAN
jgi:D-alanyl-D-alanine carboxypeptidase/D-alanyl-D-alanine-endopeptidase (penicillin-binding protein 4)